MVRESLDGLNSVDGGSRGSVLGCSEGYILGGQDMRSEPGVKNGFILIRDQGEQQNQLKEISLVLVLNQRLL